VKVETTGKTVAKFFFADVFLTVSTFPLPYQLPLRLKTDWLHLLDTVALFLPEEGCTVLEAGAGFS